MDRICFIHLIREGVMPKTGLYNQIPIGTRQLVTRTSCALAIVFTAFFSVATANAQESDDPAAAAETFRLNVGTPFANTNDLSQLNQDLEITPDTFGSQIFDLDLTGVGCLTGEERCLTSDEALDMRYSKSLSTSLIDKVIDIELTPRASVTFNDGTSSAAVGAYVKIGDDLKVGEEFKSNTWYVFAGADAEALSYAPNDMNRVTIGDFRLQENVLVGDAQAGVGYRLSESTDISLGYFRREVTSFGSENDLQRSSFSEDAAALSFTWRR